MKKIILAIRNMDFEELKELQKDMENNSELMKKEIWHRMQDLGNSEKFCATCYKELDNPKFTLIVGDKYKRKLSFCEMDCFNYFIKNFEAMKEDKVIAAR